MGIGILFIISGLICILLPKSQWYIDYIEKHNFTEGEDFLNFIRNIIGGIFIILGTIAFLIKLVTVII
jgi:hypothetical protein